MKVGYSKLALAELEQSLAYITPHSRNGSERVDSEIQRTISRIAEHPDSSPERRKRPGIRRAPLVHFPDLVYDEAEGGVVTILRNLPGARRQPWE